MRNRLLKTTSGQVGKLAGLNNSVVAHNDDQRKPS